MFAVAHHHHHHAHHHAHHHHRHRRHHDRAAAAAQLLGNPIGKEGARALINLYESHEKIATLIGIKETDTALDLKGMYVFRLCSTTYSTICQL